ncbi:thiamine phosphate synthase [Paludibacterium purpuratum]|uniref:Thiamine-phosphate synthase n=1 Tax=Paludibacterium purpuratum TaxID=1144873 RepID=A0A4R7AXT0_9NEIS|nr:thiamine phosphate synthase [Paludibacterium purpuratum]TDR72479.1 thiamine-phosphate diphosphorylase [Paludibacterium purpuratum]
MNRRHKIKGLYAITQNIVDDNHLEQVRRVLAGGASVLQYRSKSPDNALKYRQGKLLHALCREYDVLFIVNDDLDLAIKLKADGVHLGREDMTVRQARVALGSRAVIGASCYDSLDIARQAKQDGADYLAFGAVYPSSTKPHAVLAPLSLFTRARSEFELPLVAIGGINAANAQAVVDAGADALAMIQGVFASPDPYQAALDIARLFVD